MRRALSFLSKGLFALVALSLLAGCGFHLRGQVDLPFASAYVDSPAASPLTEPLKRGLRDAGKTVADKKEAAEVTIRLSQPVKLKDILSLSGAGKVAEYRLQYKVNMSVLNAQGEELLGSSEVLLVRDLTYDDKYILAKGYEEAQLFQAMEQEVLQTLLRRLRFVKGGIAHKQ